MCDLKFVGCFVMVEGCYNMLEFVKVVIEIGVDCVIVGFVLICLEYIVSWFVIVIKLVRK